MTAACWITTLVIVATLLASALRHHVLGRPCVAAWVRRGFAATYVLLAARLATAER